MVRSPEVEHLPRPQKAMGARFLACTGCHFRSGLGDEALIRQQFAEHLRLVTPPTDPYLRSADV